MRGRSLSQRLLLFMVSVLLVLLYSFSDPAFVSYSSPDLRCWFKVLLSLEKTFPKDGYWQGSRAA